MKDDRFLDNQDLKAAFRSVRDAYDGENMESNLTLQRALFRTRTGERRRRLTRWVVLPIAAVLAASSAWAGVTGKLTPAVRSMLESFHTEHTPLSSAANAPSPSTTTAPLPSTDPHESSPPSAEPSAVPVVAVEPAPPAVAVPAATISAPVAAPRTSTVAHTAQAPLAPSQAGEAAAVAVEPSSPKTLPGSAESAPPADPHAALFAEAHRLHFTERDPARALAAWDRYLAVAPNGRFSPEARYNRALSLVRLGRHAEARAELTAFANGEYGSYRRDEAKALLDALARDASSPSSP
jgi:hypothetical protein